jgi:histone H3/H4
MASKNTKTSGGNEPTVRETMKSYLRTYLSEKIGKNVSMDGEVVVAMSEMASEFLKTVIESSKEISKHRGGKTLEVRDVALHLKNEWGIQIPVRFIFYFFNKRLATTSLTFSIRQGYTGIRRMRVNSRRKKVDSSIDSEAVGVYQMVRLFLSLSLSLSLYAGT